MPWDYINSKDRFVGIFMRQASFGGQGGGGVLLGNWGNFAFQNGLVETASNAKCIKLKQTMLSKPISQWTYIQDGLFSEGCLHNIKS